MTFEKLYYDPSNYASYSALDNLTRAVKPNFSREEVRSLESQDAYVAPTIAQKISAIALQRNKH